ncbi:hypothetical protein SETIT_4G070100v2 [Setaria italica]|uniref:Uncharacterized protein n=1 Tax=Setaria italica TaxID=4555 RepID=A0A368QRL9_SETIT|nr:hypothetical protein SETIT_4G070100v2 [Setaria italica]
MEPGEMHGMRAPQGGDGHGRIGRLRVAGGGGGRQIRSWRRGGVRFRGNARAAHEPRALAPRRVTEHWIEFVDRTRERGVACRFGGGPPGRGDHLACLIASGPDPVKPPPPPPHDDDGMTVLSIRRRIQRAAVTPTPTATHTTTANLTRQAAHSVLPCRRASAASIVPRVPRPVVNQPHAGTDPGAGFVPCRRPPRSRGRMASATCSLPHGHSLRGS